MVGGVRNVNVAGCVHGELLRLVQVGRGSGVTVAACSSRVAAKAAISGKGINYAAGDDTDSLIQCVRDIKISRCVYRDALGKVQLGCGGCGAVPAGICWVGAHLAVPHNRGNNAGDGVNTPDLIVGRVRDEYISGAIDSYGLREVQKRLGRETTVATGVERAGAFHATAGNGCDYSRRRIHTPNA